MPVAEVCTITWYCNSTTFGDIHANTNGYNFIGQADRGQAGLALIVADRR